MSVVGPPPDDVERVTVRKAAIVDSDRPMEMRARAKAIAQARPGVTLSYVRDVLSKRELKRATEIRGKELKEEKLATETYRYSIRVKDQ